MASDQQADPPCGVMLENLRTKKPPSKLAGHIFAMFRSLGVISTDILSITVDTHNGTSLINLRTKEVETFVASALSDILYVMNFYDVRKVCAQPDKLKVYTRSPEETESEVDSYVNAEESVTESRATQSSQSRSQTQSESQSEQPSEVVISIHNEKIVYKADPVSAGVQNVDVSLETSFTSSTSTFRPEFDLLIDEDNVAHPAMLNAATSVDTFLDEEGDEIQTNEVEYTPDKESGEGRDEESEGWQDIEKSDQHEPTKVDVKTSTPQIGPCFCPDTIFYHKKQRLGNESRHKEFKRGGVISDMRLFRSHVGRYVCAFLNTEGGTLYFGVNDDGIVLGIRVDQKLEDRIRLTIDNAVAKIKPVVATDTYSVNFAQVMNSDGHIDQNLKVLEICVKPHETPAVMFSFDNAVLIRRDGSLRTIGTD